MNRFIIAFSTSFVFLIGQSTTTWIAPNTDQIHLMWMDSLNQYDNHLEPAVLTDLAAVNGPFKDASGGNLNDEILGLVAVSDLPDMVWGRTPEYAWPLWKQLEIPIRRRGASSISATANGKVYITWRWSHALSEAHFEQGKLVEDVVWGQAGRADGQLGEPVGVAVSTKGTYFILERLNNRISVFNSDHKFLRAIYPTRNYPMHDPVALTLHDGDEYWTNYRDSFLVIVDADGQRLVRMGLDGKLQAVKKSDFPFENYDFKQAATDYYGCVYVTDSLNDCIHKFDQNLNYLVSINGIPDGKSFLHPRGIAVDNRFGQGWVSDSVGVHYFWIGTDTLAWRAGYSTIKKAVMGSFRLTEPAYVTVRLKDAAGNILATLVDNQKYLYTTIEYRWPIPWGFDQTTVQTEVQLTPTYASRKYFTKTVTQEIELQSGSND